MLGLTPVHELNAWLANMARSYLIAREYLEPAEAARGRVFNRDDWITALLALHPQDAYVRQLAALNHAACPKHLVDAYQDRFPQQLPQIDARAVRAALGGAIDGQPRVLLARQTVLRDDHGILRTQGKQAASSKRDFAYGQSRPPEPCA